MDSDALFLISLLGLCLASIVVFATTFKRRSVLLAVVVPLIALCGSSIYFSYGTVLGYPVQMTWQQMPNKFTTIFFHIEGKETVTLWVLENNATRLIELPYEEKAENALEGERSKMGRGIPVTFTSEERGEWKDIDGSAELTVGALGPERKGEGGDGETNASSRNRGWRYKVSSYGNPIPGSLPPK